MGHRVDLGQGKLPARPNRKGRMAIFGALTSVFGQTLTLVAVGLVCWGTKGVGVWSTAVHEWMKNKVWRHMIFEANTYAKYICNRSDQFPQF